MQKPFIRGSDSAFKKQRHVNLRLHAQKGFSLLELIVSMSAGLGLVAMGLSTVDTVRNAYVHDIARTRVEQDLRSSIDMIGASLRQAGEGFTGAFPAIEVVDGTGGAPDELVVRKELLSEEPSVCAAISAGSPRGQIFFTNSTPTPGCAFSSNGSNYASWRNYRVSKGGQTLAYIYNTSTHQGEFFTYTGESNSGSTYSLTASGGNWANSYPVGAAQLYVLEEWRFRISGEELKLVENGDEMQPWDIAFGLRQLQVNVKLKNGTTVSSFSRTSDWTQIQYVEVNVVGEDKFRGNPLQVALSSRFFPRNILSN